MMTCLFTGPDERENFHVAACQSDSRDRSRRGRAARCDFPAVQDPYGSSGVWIEHHDQALVARQSAMPVFRIHGRNFGPEEHWLVHHPSHHTQHAPVLAAGRYDEAIWLIRSSRRCLPESTRGEVEARGTGQVARNSVTIENFQHFQVLVPSIGHWDTSQRLTETGAVARL